LIKTISSSPIPAWASSSKSTGRTRSFGMGRVMSLKTTAVLGGFPDKMTLRTISCSGVCPVEIVVQCGYLRLHPQGREQTAAQSLECLRCLADQSINLLDRRLILSALFHPPNLLLLFLLLRITLHNNCEAVQILFFECCVRRRSRLTQHSKK
jgi:hypothetical protein